ncbi:MAG: P27 family phage terminase small subunit [bacterium]
MAKPKLQLVKDERENSDVLRCGAPTLDDSPCRRRTGGGRCWQHAEEEPEATDDLPPPPDHLGEQGRENWYHHMADLDRAGGMDQIDLTLIEKAAEAYEAGRVAWRAVQKFGPVVKGRSGEVKKNPAVAKHLEYLREYRQYMKEIARLKAAAGPVSEPEGLGEWL